MTTNEASGIKKWVQTNLVIIVIQTAGIFWWASSINTRVDRNERDIAALQNWRNNIAMRGPGNDSGAILTPSPKP